MAPKKDKKGNGAAAPAEYQWKLKVGDRVKFIRNTHPDQYNVERELHGLSGEVTNAEIDKEGVPGITVLFDAAEGKKPGVAWVHPDDCELLLSGGTERAVEEPGDHETASVLQGEPVRPVPTEPFEIALVSRPLPCPLPEDVFKAKAQRLAAIPRAIQEIENEKSRVVDQFKKRIAGLEAEQSTLNDEVRDGTMMRDVHCRWVGDMRDKQKHCIRLDTMEIVESITLTAQECQEALDYDRPETTELPAPEPTPEPVAAAPSDDDVAADEEPERELSGSDDHDGDAASASAH